MSFEYMNEFIQNLPRVNNMCSSERNKLRRMSEDSDPRRFGPGPSSDFREDSAQQVRRFGPEGEKIRPRLYYIVFLSKNT